MKVKSEIVMLESDDIAMAISLEVERLAIRHLVVGVSSSSLFSRYETVTISNLSKGKLTHVNLHSQNYLSHI